LPNTFGRCTSLPYGIRKAEIASMLAAKIGKKRLPKKFLRQSGRSITFITTPTSISALSTKKAPGHNKVKKLPSDHLHQTAQGPQALKI
jgi:hypothetical protein